MTRKGCSDFRNFAMASNMIMPTSLDASHNKQPHQVPSDVQKTTSHYSTSPKSQSGQASSWSKRDDTSQEQTRYKLKSTACIDSSLSTHLELETRTKTSNHQKTVASTKNQTTTSKKKKRKRKRAHTIDKDYNFRDSDMETIDVYYDDDVDDDKENKAIQLAILASLNAKHKEEEKMKGDDSEIVIELNNLDQSEIEELAKDIYGGDEYDGEISKEDLENMRDVLKELIEHNDEKNDKESTIEKILLENNIKLIDAEMQRRDRMKEQVNVKSPLPVCKKRINQVRWEMNE